MGAGASTTLSPVSHGFSTMSITFECSDRLTALHLDDSSLSTIRQAINEVWPSGIQQEEAKCGAGWSFKLHGKPFGLLGLKETGVPARRIVCQILQRLHAIGWKVLGSATLGRGDYRSTLFFERVSPQFGTHPFVAVGLQNSDKLKFVNMPVELVQPVKEMIKSTWEPGIQQEDLVDGTLVLKLRGTPWKSSEEQTTMSRLLLQNLINVFHRHQWGYYCSVNFELCDLHSLIFNYNPDIKFGDTLTLCSIDFKKFDRLRLINAPPEIINVVRGVITAHWKPGKIQSEHDYHSSREFKLSGTPWHCQTEQSARARFLVAKILEALQEHGWSNIAGFNCSQRFVQDKATLVFKKLSKVCEPADVMCLALNDTDKLRLINMPPEVAELIKNMILARWPKGIQAQKQISLHSGSVTELKLSGNPWAGGHNDDTLHGCSLFCNILDELKQRGWKLLTSTDVSSKYYDDDNNIPMDPYSFWFTQEPLANNKHVPSAPTYDTDFTNFSTTQYPEHGTGNILPPAITQLPFIPPDCGFNTAFEMQPPSYFSTNPYQPPPSYAQVMAPSTYNEKS